MLKSSFIPNHFAWRPTALAAMLSVVPVLAVAQQAAAPAGAPGDKTTLESVTISARKRPEPAQTVPLAVTAFNANTLERGKIALAQDLQFSIPNAVLVGNDRFAIRGISGDGVGLGVNGATVGFLPQDELFDMERIEVLRGPQGTLFGRNTTGGALSIFTKRATDKLDGRVSVELGNYNARRVDGMINIPLSDDLQTRFSGYSLKREGYTFNEYTGNSIDGRDQYSLRNSTRLRIGDKVEANLVLGAYKEDSSRTRETKRQCKAVPVLGCSPYELGFDSPDSASTVVQTLAKFFTPFPSGASIYAGAPNPLDMRRVSADFDATFKLKQQFATLDLSYELSDDLTLAYVGGISSGETEQNTDWDNAALPFRFTKPITYNMSRNTVVTTDRLLTTDSFTNTNTTKSHEIRLVSHNKGSFNYTTGLFSYDQISDGGFFIWNPAFEYLARARGWSPDAYFVNGESKIATTKALAWFGEGQWAASDKLRATLGARYSSEDKNNLSRNIVLTDVKPFVQQPEISSRWWTGRAAVDYVIAPDMLLYGTVATGYKGGGFNAGNATNPTFDPETVRAYELGLKSESMGGKLRANFSAFYNDYKGMQLAQRIASSFITSNADARIFGVEAEFMYAPSRQWLFDANVGFLQTRINDFVTQDAANPAQSLEKTSPPVAINLAGNKLPNSPEFKIKVGAQYSTAFLNSGWSSTARIDYVWQDNYFAREFNTPTDRIGAWGITNLQWRFDSPNKKLSVSTFVKNATGENNITSIVIEDAVVGSYRNVRLLDPRTYGVKVEYKM